MSYSATRGAPRSNRFILTPDITNKYRVNSVVAETVFMPNSIPFLRDQRNVSNQTFSKVNDTSFAATAAKIRAQVHIRAQSTILKRKKKREVGWDNYIKPISKYNERVHSSMRVVFEKI